MSDNHARVVAPIACIDGSLREHGHGVMQHCPRYRMKIWLRLEGAAADIHAAMVDAVRAVLDKQHITVPGLTICPDKPRTPKVIQVQLAALRLIPPVVWALKVRNRDAKLTLIKVSDKRVAIQNSVMKSAPHQRRLIPCGL